MLHVSWEIILVFQVWKHCAVLVIKVVTKRHFVILNEVKNLKTLRFAQSDMKNLFRHNSIANGVRQSESVYNGLDYFTAVRNDE